MKNRINKKYRMKGQKAIVYVYGCVALFFLFVNFIRPSAAWVLGSGIIFFLTVLLSSMGKRGDVVGNIRFLSLE